MRYPDYSLYPQPRTSLLHTYARTVGSEELLSRRELESLPPASPHRSAIEIGRACMMILHGNTRAASRALETLHGQTAASLAYDNEASRQQRIQHHIAGMLADRDDDTRAASHRQNLHGAVVDVVRADFDLYKNSWIDLPEKKNRVLVGAITETTATGLLTRLAHPWMLAVPALPQHDKVRVPGVRHSVHNFDTLMIDTGPEQAGNTAYRLQTKAACIGVCAMPKFRQHDKSKSATHIAFVSGHCDLGTYRDRLGEFQSPLTELLIREYDDTATSADIQTLDAATGALLLNLTLGDPRRQGTWTPALQQSSVAIS